MSSHFKYLKKHTEALTLGRYYSDNLEHTDRYMPIDAVVALEAAASYPHVTTALAEINGNTLSSNGKSRPMRPSGCSRKPSRCRRFWSR